MKIVLSFVYRQMFCKSNRTMPKASLRVNVRLMVMVMVKFRVGLSCI